MSERNHKRCTPEGRELGAHLARLTEATVARLVAEGEPDARCASCAFRLGTVPNGCPQTQLDALKAVMEGVLFTCHAGPKDRRGEFTMPCHGWYAARVALRGTKPIKCPYEFSKDEEPEPTGTPAATGQDATSSQENVSPNEP